MGETGQVVELDGDFVKIRMTRQKACEKCRACAPSVDGMHMYLSAQNACGADVGDWVSVDLDGGFFLRAVLIMYGLPLVMLLAGFGLGTGAAGVLGIPLEELAGFASGIMLAALTYFVISRLQHKIDRGKNAPVATRKVEAAE
ncbi:MAG: SoxR reducing system RseC family protein [Defluviitaleaceae bacterium]|nr:SoxR reducing system RseC family protein [Defluviitaleaceae bacterium]